MSWVGLFFCIVLVCYTIDSIFEKYFEHRRRLLQMELDHDKEG